MSHEGEEADIEIEELSDTQRPEAAAASGLNHSDGPGLARFAVGALVLVVAVGLLLVAFGSGYYEVSYRSGPEPGLAGLASEGMAEDDSPTIRYTVRLQSVEAAVTEVNGNPQTENQDYTDDAPLVGVAMDRLRWTGYIGAGLVGLVLLAAVLHRFGALTVSGPAPVMATFAVIFLAAGVVSFAEHIPTYARSEWVPGFLDLVPAFFTSNADGNAVHDLAMRPLAGFWLHALGVLAVPVGAALTFWDHLLALKAKGRSLAEEAALD